MSVKIEQSKKVVIEDIDTIYITGGGFINKAFKGIGKDSAWAFDEVVWNANLSRSSSFQMTNIDNVGIGKVTNLELRFPLLNMQDFIDLQTLLHERHLIVNFFNVDKGKRETKEMAITSNERKTIYNFGKDVIGMRDVKIKMVATNRKIEEDIDNLIGQELTITYINVSNNKTHTDKARYGQQYRIKTSNEIGFTNEDKKFLWWKNYNDSTLKYLENQSMTMWKSITIYGEWE